jgi:tetraacyldisaccharide 4'-kinase
VGNLVAGGSGKTPLVAAIALGLADAGFRPALLVGGYRSRAGEAAARTGSGATLVTPDSDAARVGDEALLLVQETGLPVAAGRERSAAVDLLRRTHPGCDVIISDDGLQHVGLERHIEILVIDDRGFGNGRCLPAGPLREPADRAASVDAIVVTSPRAPAQPHGPMLFRSELKMRRMRTLDGAFCWTPAEFAAEFDRERLSAIAGIARPARFFSSLDALGLDAQCHPLPDHADIDKAWLAALPGRWILMTGKDAVKCRHFGASLLHRCVRVDVAAAPDAALVKWLAVRLRPTAHRNG